MDLTGRMVDTDDPDEFLLFSEESVWASSYTASGKFNIEKIKLVRFIPDSSNLWWKTLFKLYDSSGKPVFENVTFRMESTEFASKEELLLYAESVGRKPVYVYALPTAPSDFLVDGKLD